MKKSEIKAIADRYVGRAPALGYGGVNGPDREADFEDTCRVVEEIVAIHAEDRRRAMPSPAASSASPTKVKKPSKPVSHAYAASQR